MILQYVSYVSIAQGPQWTKSAACLYRYNPTGTYHARVRFGGRLFRRSRRALKADAYVEWFDIVFTALESKGATAIVRIADGRAPLPM